MRANPFTSANFFSRLFFCWVSELFSSGRKRQLESDDLFELGDDDQTSQLAQKLEKEWNDEIIKASKQNRKPSLGRAMVAVFGRFYLLLGFVQCTEELMKVMQPLMISGLLSALSRSGSEEGAQTEAVMYAVSVSFCSVMIAVLHHPQFFHVLRLGMWLRVSACALLYKKILRLNQQSMLQVSTGKIVNMMTNDVQRMDQACAFLHFLWIGPLQTIVVLVILWHQVGIAAVAGVAALVLMSPVQFWIARLFARIRSKTAVLTDERVKLTSEMIHGMRVVKMYCWEQMFVKLISKVRRKELDRVTQAATTNIIKIVQYMVHTKAAMFVFMGTAVALAGSEDGDTDKGVSVSNVFLVLCMLNAIRVVLTIFIPLAAQFGSEGKISIDRFQKVLLLDELDSSNKDEKQEEVFVSMEKFCATWEATAESPTLSDISLSANKSELIGVIGPVGAGKSSLLMALLGELPPSSGTVQVSGSVAYISQQPWVFAATVRQNVVFGRKWDKQLYEASIRAAALDKDLKQLPNGDRTIVGERGVTLSGGQKARVALARGLYSDANIYLLDDPLSAVDTAVAKHLFHRCIRGHLKGRVRILVTHQMQFLKDMDRIFVFRGGEMLKSGTYQELINSGLDLENLLTESDSPEPGSIASPMQKSTRHMDSVECIMSSTQASRSNSRVSLEAISYISLADMAETDGAGKEGEMKYEQQEERAIGTIDWSVYYKFFTAGANCVLLFGLFVLFSLAQLAYVLCDWWLTVWMKWERLKALASFQNDTLNATFSTNATDPFAAAGIAYVRHFEASTTFLFVLGMLTLGVFVCTLFRSIGFVAFSISASYTLHQRMLRRVVHATTQFFDTNSVGRILNRFSKDVGVMDEMLPPCLSDFFICFFLVVGNLSVNFAIAPWTIIGVLPLGFLFVILRQYYMMTSRSVKRLEAVARSPVFSHLNNTLLGLATVRSSGSEELFIQHYCNLQDEHSRSWFAFLSTSRWFGIRLDWLCVTFVMISCTASVSVPGLDDTQVGLMLTYAVGLLGMFQWCVRQSTEVENHMVCIERIVDYTQLPQEPPFRSPSDKNLPEAWPAVGALEFRDVNFAYERDGPRVLKAVSFRVLPREKIGIVGRTGAGKSSLIYCLFRLAEVEPGGAILIDAQPTGPPMGLHTLRRSISIIPQDPVLFTGTVRWNLDPTGLHDDEALWRALDDVQMREPIAAMFGGLDAKVAESGVNLSVGQRQLMCLARALLGENRILVIDEATANVDPTTDSLIQQTIRSKFCNCTVLTIAHRLHTIMDSDRVMVMDSGQLVEFDHPKVLIDRADSYFSKMLHQLDTEHVQTLHGIAQASYHRRRESVEAENGFYRSPSDVELPSTLEVLSTPEESPSKGVPVNRDLARVVQATARIGHSLHSLNSIFEADEDGPEKEPLV